MTLILKAEGLVKFFGGQLATDAVSLNLAAGEIRCLIGPNGAGKSTVLRLLAGLYSPKAGSISFNGSDITRAPMHMRARLGMGIKFQVPSIFPDLPVRQNLRIAVQAASAGIDQSRERVLELLDLLHLGHHADMPAATLSHGQKQWLEIGMAIGRRPSLLLLDEPTAGMSPQETEETGRLVLDLNRRGITVLAVEHDMRFVSQIATTVTVLQTGRIFFEGPPDDVMADRGVAAIYLGSPR